MHFMLDAHMHGVHIGAMTLNEFILAEQDRAKRAGKPPISDTAFGAMVGLSQTQVGRLRRLESRPSWRTMEAIEKATKGKVKANGIDWPARMEAAE